jgi:hypothetical protein
VRRAFPDRLFAAFFELFSVGRPMAVGDKEAAVIACVNASLKARGYDPPYDPNGTMSGRYKYQFETIILFHRQVKACLAAKGYTYNYPETQEYINQTLAMTLAQVYAAIDVKTGIAAQLESVGGELSNESVPILRAKKVSKARRVKAGRSKKKTGKKTIKKTAKKRGVSRKRRKK